MNATFIEIEDEFKRLFKLLSSKERRKNLGLRKQIALIRLRIQAIKEELQRQRFARNAEV